MTDPRLNQELRRRCLSATDLVKLRHFGGALTVWARKIKGIEPEFDARSQERMMAGTLFEAPIFEWYSQQEFFEHSFSPQTMEHSNGWLCATPDYVTRIGPRLYRVVEIKTRSTRATTAPLEWVDQVHVQWAVVQDWLRQRGLGDLDHQIHVACCHMQWGPEFRVWPVELHSAHLVSLLDFGQDWWIRHIRDEEKPEPGHSRSDTDMIGRLYPGGDSGQYHVAPAWAEEAIEKDAALSKEMKELEQERDAERNKVRDLIGEADGLVREGSDREVLWSWRTNKNGTRHLRRHG